MERSSRIQRWFGTSSRPDHGVDVADAVPFAAPDLDAIRSAMRFAMSPCSEQHRLKAEDQISHAHSAVELWLIRADIFQYIGQDMGQMEAARRIAAMLPLFEGVIPSVAMRHKISDNRGHDPRPC